MYVYIYVYMHVCMYVCMYVYVYVYIYIYICITDRDLPASLRRDADEPGLLPRGFQGYWLQDTLKGLQFEETNTQIILNHTLIE